MPQIIEQGDIFGRIGKGLGQGAGEQVERGMLSKGIQKIAENKNATPLQQYAQLHALPGGAQVAPGIQPFLASERARQASAELYPQGAGRKESAEEIGKKVAGKINEPPKYDRESENYLLPASQEKINQRAQGIAATTGLLFPEALAQAEKEDKTRITNELAFEERNTLAEKTLDDYLSTELQKSGGEKFRDIIGEMQNEYKTKVQNLVANGMSPRQAGLQEAKSLLDFAKTRGKLSTQGVLGAYNLSPNEARRSVKDIRKTYEDADKLELFRNDLISKVGMSREYADSIAFPIENNADLAATIKDIGLTNRLGKVDELFGKIEKDIAKDPNASINAISLALSQRGVNPDKFRNRMSRD